MALLCPTSNLPTGSRLILKMFYFYIYLFIYFKFIYNILTQASMPLILKFHFMEVLEILPILRAQMLATSCAVVWTQIMFPKDSFVKKIIHM